MRTAPEARPRQGEDRGPVGVAPSVPQAEPDQDPILARSHTCPRCQLLGEVQGNSDQPRSALSRVGG